jgi:hypothetical protein
MRLQIALVLGSLLSATAQAQSPAPTSETGSRTLVFRLANNPQDQSAELAQSCQGVPNQLFLRMTMNKEYQPFHRHASGDATASVNQDGSSPYPLLHIRIRIRMPTPGNSVEGNYLCFGQPSCRSDVRFGGTASGEFTSDWYVEAQHPCFNKGQVWSYGTQY